MNKDNSPKLQHLKYQSSIFCFHLLKCWLTCPSWSSQGSWGPMWSDCCRGWSGRGHCCTRRPRPRPSSCSVSDLLTHNNIDSASALCRVRVKTGPECTQVVAPTGWSGRVRLVSQMLSDYSSLTRAGATYLGMLPPPLTSRHRHSEPLVINHVLP